VDAGFSLQDYYKRVITCLTVELPDLFYIILGPRSCLTVRRDSAVGIATGYGTGRPRDLSSSPGKFKNFLINIIIIVFIIITIFTYWGRR
jgi:hypothetical protein